VGTNRGGPSLSISLPECAKQITAADVAAVRRGSGSASSPSSHQVHRISWRHHLPTYKANEGRHENHRTPRDCVAAARDPGESPRGHRKSAFWIADSTSGPPVRVGGHLRAQLPPSSKATPLRDQGLSQRASCFRRCRHHRRRPGRLLVVGSPPATRDDRVRRREGVPH